MRYIWDERKNRANARKHAIRFEDAVVIWEDYVFEWIDDSFDYGEERVLAIGLMNGIEIVVIYTDRREGRRIISARKADTREREGYWQARAKKERR
jgi:uncharacterized protein